MSEGAEKLTDAEIAALCAAYDKTSGEDWLTPIGRIPYDDRLVCADDGLNVIGEFKRVEDAVFVVEVRESFPSLVATIEALEMARDAALKRAEDAERQLDLIDQINEDDWESGEAASWVAKIRSGQPLDGMVTQEQYEASYFGDEGDD